MGSSLRVLMARICVNAAIGTAWMEPSTPPVTTMSASPITIIRHALAMASEPDEQAETGVETPARAPNSMPTQAAGPLGMMACTVSGETLR